MNIGDININDDISLALLNKNNYIVEMIEVKYDNGGIYAHNHFVDSPIRVGKIVIAYERGHRPSFADSTPSLNAIEEHTYGNVVRRLVTEKINKLILD